MKLGVMFNELARSLVTKPATRQYPYEASDVPSNLRGLLQYDAEKCTGCQLCVKDCPANALDLFILDRKAKRFVMRYHANRCIYCLQCVVSCRFDALKMNSDSWELASLKREPFVINFGSEEDVSNVLEEESKKEAAGS